jgi:hypothetical protein
MPSTAATIHPISTVANPHPPQISIQHLGTSDAIASHHGSLDILHRRFPPTNLRSTRRLTRNLQLSSRIARCRTLSVPVFSSPLFPNSMDLPLRAYFFSPLNNRIDRSLCFICVLSTSPFVKSYVPPELRDHDKLLNTFNVDVQSTRVADILTTFHATLHDESRSALLLFAESLRVSFSLLLHPTFLKKKTHTGQPESVYTEL